MLKDKHRGFVLPEVTDEKMLQIAKVKNITHSQVYRDAVEFFVNNWEFFYTSREAAALKEFKEALQK